MKRLILILFAFVSTQIYSQSLKIDGATGRSADLAAITVPDSSDQVFMERSDSSKSISYGNFMTHSGGLSFLSTEGEQTIGTGGTFERLFEGNMAYTGVHLDDFTESDGRLTYTGSVLKHFDISAYMSIESGEVAQRIEIRIAQGGTTIEGSNMPLDFTALSSDRTLSTGFKVEMQTNDYIEVYGTSDTNGDTFTIHNFVLNISQQ